jgi:alpha-L-rhamnosidase
MAETHIFEFDLRRILEKWMGDLRDSQGENGLFPGIAPDNGWGLGWPGQARPGTWRPSWIDNGATSLW